MEFALNTGIFQFNVESEPELELLNKVAEKLGKIANIAIRVNPEVDAGTHVKITTGLKTSKFGIDINLAPAIYEKAAQLKNINPRGISVHIGSQITTLKPFEAAFIRVREFLHELTAKGLKIETLDLGGGLGVPYELGKVPPHPRDYAKMVRVIFSDFKGKMIFEPGRVISGNSGILVSEVIYVKPTDERVFLIVDAAMNDLIRPSYYAAHHDIVPVKLTSHVKPGSKTASVEYDIVGPVCETGDTFAQQRELPELKAGDLIAFRTAGAYGAVMASTYNSRRIVPEVMVKDGEFALTSRRMSYDEMFEREEIPSFLKS
jgi:diaminopimelate decarboxylase